MSIKYVEYLESDGASYIDTGISYNNQSWGAVYKVQFDSINYWGTSPLSDDINNTCKNSLPAPMSGYSNYEITYNSNSKTRTRVTNESLQPFNTTDIFEFDFNVTTPNVTIINGVECQTPTTNISSNGNMMLYWSPERQYSKMKIYELKLYQDGALVRDFKPCLDEEGTPCMYDLVTEQYFYNNGSGTFTHGGLVDALYLFANNNNATAENLGSYRLYNMKIEGDLEGVKADEINYVDYLESDGASWIDTGIMTNENTQIEVTCQLVARENYRSWFGSDKISAGWQVTDGNGVFRLQGNAVTVVGELRTNLYGKKVWKMDTSKVVIGEKIFFVNIDGVDKAEGTITKNENSTKTLKLFASHVEGDVIRSDIEYSIKGRIYDFKVHMDGQLKMHLKPCLDTEGIPCMYDEVSKQYFYNQGSGTFGYKKELRDFQPVLDSNGVPCLMDKINKKYYYDKNGKGFGCDGYSGVSYLKGDYNSYIDTGLIANEMHGYKIEIKFKRVTTYSIGNQLVFGSSNGGFDNASTNAHLRYNYYAYPQGLSCSDEDTTAMYNPSVDTILDIDFTINTPTSNVSFYLFAGNSHDTPLGTCDATIYYWKVYDTNNNLIQHLIPAIDTNGSIGMYDLVTETFHYNQGTGTFSYGIEESECPPVDYVEYLSVESSQQKYIHLEDIHMPSYSQDNISYEVKFKQLSNHGAVVGDVNVSVGSFPCFNRANNKLMIRFGRTVTEFNYLRNDEVHTITYNINGGREVIANGVNLGVPTSPNNFDYTSPIRLFNSYNNSYPSGYVTGEFYYFKIWDNGTLIHYVKPFIDDNGVTGVYDEVTGKSYMCEDIAYANPSYNPIKYIETNGTQYIDTGVVVNDNTYMDIDYRAVDKLHYIEDGLILRLDAIDNTRDGHNASSTVWEDLSGNGLDFDLTDVTVNDTTMTFNGTSSVGTLQDIELWRNIVNNTEQYTVEVCFKFSGTESYNPIISTNLGNVNVSSFVDAMQVGQQSVGALIEQYEFDKQFSTISCDANDIIYHVNTKLRETLDKGDYIYPPTTDAFWIGARLTGQYYYLTGELCSIRIYNKKLTDEERLYNHSSDVARYGVPTDVSVIDTDRNYLMNDFYTDTTYKYKETDTTVEPNLTASTGATLTLGSTYIPYLTEIEIEQAIKNGWIIQ